MTGRLPVFGLIAAAVALIADQVTKWIVTGPLDLDTLSGRVIDIVPIFRVRFVANAGVSLGLLYANTSATRWALVVLTAGIALGVLIWMWREKWRADQVALGFVFGGALGNIADRVRLGYVVDFADLHFGEWSPFLVFNVGDAAITIGVLVLLARAVLIRDKAVTPGVSVENGNA
ncbi:MAG: signal peptidase II [Sphingomonas sp.]|jgi:signal peptidase II